ncbi:uncharacterized protein ACJ7VT_015404 [Polymixia lowei]
MTVRAALLYLCSLAVLSCCIAQDHETTEECSSHTQLLEGLSAKLRDAVACSKTLSQWSSNQTAALLHDMRTFSETLHQHQLTACQGAEPNKCPDPDVHSNGGMVCVSVGGKRYCKPMCNQGYDFDFLRRSRVYEECSEERSHKWSTQYIGGNRLAVCNKSSTQVSGAETAYFPKDQDCLVTKSSSQLQKNVIDKLIDELREHDVNGEPSYACLVCG